MVDRRDVLKMGAGAALAASILPRVGASATQAGGVRGFYLTGLTGSQLDPPVRTGASGGALFTLDRDGQRLRYAVAVHNIRDVRAIHIRRTGTGERDPIVAWLYPSVFAERGRLTLGRSDSVIAEGTLVRAAFRGPLDGEPMRALLRLMERGEAYVTVNTRRNPRGELRGQIITPREFALMVGTVVDDGSGTTTFGTTDTTDGFDTTDRFDTTGTIGTTGTRTTDGRFGTTRTTRTTRTTGRSGTRRTTGTTRTTRTTR